MLTYLNIIFSRRERFSPICSNEKLKFGVDFNKKNIVVDFWYIISNSNWYKNVHEHHYCKIELSMASSTKVFKEGKKHKMNKVHTYQMTKHAAWSKRVKILWNKWYLYLYNKVFIFKQRYFNTICQNQHDIFFLWGEVEYLIIKTPKIFALFDLITITSNWNFNDYRLL